MRELTTQIIGKNVRLHASQSPIENLQKTKQLKMKWKGKGSATTTTTTTTTAGYAAYWTTTQQLRQQQTPINKNY